MSNKYNLKGVTQEVMKEDLMGEAKLSGKPQG